MADAALPAVTSVLHLDRAESEMVEQPIAPAAVGSESR